MSNKSIVDIEVKDESFNRFLEAFGQYQAKLDKSPEAWKKLEDAMTSAGGEIRYISSGTKEALSIAAASAGMVSAEMLKATKAQDQFHSATRRSGGAMKALSNTASTVSKTIFSIGKTLLKIGTISGGLAGIGSFFGMESLASSAMATERTSLGLGVPPGMLRSFRIHMAPYAASPDSLLQSVFAAKHSWQSQPMMAMALGKSMGQINQMDAGELATQGMLSLHDYWKGLPESQRTQEMLKARGFADMGFSVRDAELAMRTPRGELQRAARATMQDASPLGMTRQAAEAWTELSVQLNKSWEIIKSSLITQLAPLAKDLAPLSAQLGEDMSSLVKMVFSKETLGYLHNGIAELTEGLKPGGEFSRHMHAFSDAIKGAAHAVEWFAGKMGWTSGQDEGGSTAWRVRDQISPTAQFYDRVRGLSKMGRMHAKGWTSTSSYDDDLRMKLGNPKLETKEKQSMAFLESLGMTKAQAAVMVATGVFESRMDPLRRQDKGGPGYGLIQWCPERQKLFEKMYGHSIQKSNYQEQWRFAVWELKHKYPMVWAQMQQHPDDAAALMADFTKGYVLPEDTEGRIKNATPLAMKLSANAAGLAEDSIRKPTSTEILLQRIANTLDRMSGVPNARADEITITNNTSANVARSTNAMGN